MEPLIWSQVQKFCDAIHNHAASNNGVVELYTLCVAFTYETVARYLVAKDLDLLSDPQKAREWIGMTRTIQGSTPLVKQFPWILPWSEKLPLPVVKVFNPDLAKMLTFNTVGRVATLQCL